MALSSMTPNAVVQLYGCIRHPHPTRSISILINSIVAIGTSESSSKNKIFCTIRVPMLCPSCFYGRWDACTLNRFSLVFFCFDSIRSYHSKLPGFGIQSTQQKFTTDKPLYHFIYLTQGLSHMACCKSHLNFCIRLVNQVCYL